jgi:hypothetical protein
LDHLTGSQDEGKGLIPIHRAVELGSVRQPTGVKDSNGIAALRCRAATRGDRFNFHAEQNENKTMLVKDSSSTVILIRRAARTGSPVPDRKA